jgi:hypothetical protein
MACLLPYPDDRSGKRVLLTESLDKDGLANDQAWPAKPTDRGKEPHLDQQRFEKCISGPWQRCKPEGFFPLIHFLQIGLAAVCNVLSGRWVARMLFQIKNQFRISLNNFGFLSLSLHKIKEHESFLP